MDQEVNRIIKEYREKLIQMGIHPEKIILFGSCARGDSSDDSDIDLLLVAREFRTLDLWERMSLLRRARVGINRPVEILGMTPDEAENPDLNSLIKNEVLEKGLQVA